jgi:outer membrane protein assembly factor BamB
LRISSILTILVIAGGISGSVVAQQDGKAEGDDRWRALVSEIAIPGGLAVQVECRDASAAIALARKSSRCLIHCLVSDAQKLDAVREQIHGTGLYGRVSAMHWDEPVLPYAGGTVNLLMAFPESGAVPQDEVERLLAPGGKAIQGGLENHSTYRQPWPEEIDRWSHSRYDATGNAVSGDEMVGPPRYLQWKAKPRWNHGVKTSGLVSMQGRLFYILDDSHFASNVRTWSVFARDAFNGVLLWRRRLPSWEGARGGKKVGPAQVNRRLLADQRYVYVPLGEGAPVSLLEGATGEVVRTLKQTEGVEEFLLSEGILVALIGSGSKQAARRGEGDARELRLIAVDPDSGKTLWQKALDRILPMTLASDGTQVVYHDGRVLHGLELSSGKPRWVSPPTGQKIEYRDRANPDSPGAEKGTILLAPQLAPTLIIYQDVVAFAGGRQLNVVSAENGKELWRTEYAASNYSTPVDLFGFEGHLWGPAPSMNLWRPMDDDVTFLAYDRHTGEIVERVQGHFGYRFQHHRCHQMKVIGDTVISGRAGIEFLDTDNGELVHHHWTRGSCYFGVLPANGLLYVPPHDCACYVRAKLSGFMAMNSRRSKGGPEISGDGRLERGPAYKDPISYAGEPDHQTWPTYRGDMERSGAIETALRPELTEVWRASPGSDLTSPIIADGKVFLAATDRHTLVALDAETGKRLWKKVFNARIDSPPTFSQGRLICGCRDGTVHALRASDGESVWRFVACPAHRLIVARGQLESTWPVHGSVLVLGDTVYFTAGRSSYLDGGIRFFGLDTLTGKKRFERVLSSRNEDGSETLDEEGVEGYLTDILSSDGKRIFLRHHVFGLDGTPLEEQVTHLHGADGFLSGETTNRLLWTYAPMFTSPHQGAFYDQRLSRMLFPSGRILVETEDTIFGYGQNRYAKPSADPGGQWALFATDKTHDTPLGRTARQYLNMARSGETAIDFHWWKKVPVRVRAIVKTKDVLFVAGPSGAPTVSPAALAGRERGVLLAVAPESGELLAEISLPSAPVWDGMASAGESIYLSLVGGEVVALKSENADR